MRLSTVQALIGVMLGVLALAAAIYGAGRNQERTADALRRLCEQVRVLQQIEVSEHPAYSPTIYTSKGCDE